MQRRDYKAAIECLKMARALKVHKNVLYLLAQCKMKLGDIAGAIAELEQGLLPEDDPAERDRIRRVLQELKDTGAPTGDFMQPTRYPFEPVGDFIPGAGLPPNAS